MVADNGATAEAVRSPAGVDSGARAMTGSLVALVFGTALAVLALIAAAPFANRVRLRAPPGAWVRLRHVRDLYQALRGFGLDASPC